MLPLLASNLIAVQEPAIPPPMNLACPDEVRHQLDGLYQWQVQRMDQPNSPAASLSSQSERFSPRLFSLLTQARQLTPSKDGRYLDFDVFSNTQVRTFSAVITGCSAAQKNSILAAVEVQAGLRKTPSATPRRLEYELQRDCTGQWKIAEITYRNERVFHLRTYLEKLVNPTP